MPRKLRNRLKSKALNGIFNLKPHCPGASLIVMDYLAVTEMHFVFQPLVTSSKVELRQLLGIYHKAFPACERRHDSMLREDLRSGVSKAFIAKATRRVIFFINFYAVPNSPLIFLDYAATDPAHRGNNVIRCFFGQAFTLFGGEPILFAQLEDPNFGDNRKERRERIAYFRRIGFQFLKNAPYILPDHSGGDRLTQMVLCVMARRPLSTLPGHMIADAITFIFTQVYRSTMDDPLLAQNLSVIPKEIEVY